MLNKYIYSDFDEFFTESKQLKTIIFPNEAGILKRNSIVINENLTIHRNDFEIKKNISIEYDIALNGITINIGLEANFEYKSQLSRFELIQNTNNTTISLINSEKGKSFHKENSKMKNIIIFVKLNFLKNLLNDSVEIKDIVKYLKNKNNSLLLKSTQTDIQTKLCAYAIYNSSWTTKLDTIFVESKVLEILSYELQGLLKEKKEENSNIIFDEYNKRALEKAKVILIKDLQNPPSISELSKLVNLNEFKLKYGFKKLFNITPYNFLLQHKLFKAKELLESGEMNVSEVALKIGYKQSHGFSNAFVKQFGIRPKELIKNRKYYY